MQIRNINPWVNGLQLFYAFGTGERPRIRLIASVTELNRGSQVNPSRSCGRLNANVPTNTAERCIPSIQPAHQTGKQY